MKKSFFLTIATSIFAFPISAMAQNFATPALQPPSLEETLKKNEEHLKVLILKEEMAKNPIKKPEITQNEFVFHTIYSGSSIVIKKAEFANFWIQDIHIGLGARVDSALEVVNYNTETGEPQFVKKNMSETLKTLEKKPKTLINGQFFNPKINPTELSFGLKTGGIIRSAGADNGREKKNIIHIEKNFAEILPYSWENLKNTTGDFAIVNLSLENSRHRKEAIGRTYMCLKNPVWNRSSVLSVFVADAITEEKMETEMRKHGCNRQNTSQLDSSGSTRIWIDGQDATYGNGHRGEPDRRHIPHSILFYEK